ncbi:MAG: hypothetical protein KDD64_17025, partial [Bdellovibrionales bacterium]|nr:hypothetical protein [Bdellovibrionales bacterium]
MNYRPPRDRKPVNVIQQTPVTFWSVVGIVLQVALIMVALRLFMLMASFPIVHIPLVDEKL